MQKGQLTLPCLANRHRLSADMPFVILHTSLKQQLVQLLKRRSFGNGDHIVPPAEPNPMLDLPLLPTGTRRAEVRLKQIVGAERHKDAVFYSLSFLSFLLHG